MKKYNYTATGQRYPDSLLDAYAALNQMDQRTKQYKTAKQDYQAAYKAYYAEIVKQYPGAKVIGSDYYTNGNGHELIIIE